MSASRASYDGVGCPFRRSFEIRTLPADGDLVAVEFPLFRKYQICHHRENPEEVQLFLSPFSKAPTSSSTFHMPHGLRSYWVVHMHHTMREKYKSSPGMICPQAYDWAWILAADRTTAVQVTEATFRRFLIDTPLTPSFSPGGVRFGSYHQQYWVDGERPHGQASVHSLTMWSPLKLCYVAPCHFSARWAPLCVKPQKEHLEGEALLCWDLYGGMAWLNSLLRRAPACAGELIAVGVVDVLPRCLSSAYLFWDPALSWLALGKLTALKEIAWVQAAGARCPALRSYHMVRSAALRRGRPLTPIGTIVRLHIAALSMHAEGNAILTPCSALLAR